MKPTHLILFFLLIIGLSACQTSPEPAAATVTLGNYKWELIELDGQAVSKDGVNETPHLIFLESEQRIAGSAGCNRIMGGYEMSVGNIRLGNVATTMMACPGMATEAAFLEALRSYKSSSLQDGTLLLLGDAGEPVARFVATSLPE